jgi:pilus assembly protein CpaF
MTATAPVAESSGLEIILGYLSPIRPLFAEDDCDEVQIQAGGRRVFTRRRGVRKLQAVEIDSDALFAAVKRIALAAGQEVLDHNGGLRSAELNCRFPTGERLAVMFYPHSADGMTVTLRRFGAIRMSLGKGVKSGMLSQEHAHILRSAVVDGKNVIICGNLGSGKTTLLNMLAAFIPDDECILTIENPCELELRQPDVVRWEALGEMTQRRHLQAALRHGADRVLIGEIRGEEAIEFLELLNLGLRGTLTSLHANSAEQGLERLLTCCLKSPEHPPVEALKWQISSSINYSVHLTRNVRTGVRAVDGLVQVEGYDFASDKFRVVTL